MKRILSVLCIAMLLISTLATVVLPAAADTAIVNLFDPDKAVNECYYGDTPSEAASWWTSEYIPIQNGDVITFGPAASGQGYHLVLTDTNKTTLTRPAAAACTLVEDLGGNNIYSYTINNENVAYLRISTTPALKEELLMTKNRPFTNAERQAFLKGEIVNQFDAAQAVNEVYYNNNGPASSADYLSSHCIEAQTGDTITFGAMGNQGYHLVLMDQNKTVLSRPKGTVKETLSGNLYIYEHTIATANVAYVRVTIQLALGTNLPDTFLLTVNRPFTNAERLAFFAAGGGSEERPLPTEPSHLINHYDFFQSVANVIHNSATPSTAAGFSTSRAIKVTPGETIYMGPCNPNQGYHLAYFSGEEESTWMGRIIKNDSRLTVEDDTRDDGYVIYSFTVPEGANYLRVPVANAVADEFILTRGQDFSEEDRWDYFAYSPLYEKAALFVGDSITDGTQDSVYGRWHGWAYRIGEAYDMTWVNKGLSGTSISTARKATFGTIVDQMLTQKEEDFDYVILHGGVNDAWSQAAVGTVAEGFDPAKFDVTTFAGGLEDLIYNALYYFGDQAAIGYIMNFQTPNYQGTSNVHDMSAYYAVAEKVCNKWGIRFFDMYNNSRITADLKVDTTTYMNDYLHPNSAGYDLLSPFIAEWMDTLSNEGNRRIVTNMVMTTNPTKTEYWLGEALDLSGGKLTITYSDGDPEEVDLSKATVTGFNNTTAGHQILTVSYEGFTTNLVVTVKAKAVSSIAITQKPQKLTYELGEALDLAGLKVTAYYNDNTSKAVTGYTVSGKTDKAGEQTVTVTFEGKKATFTITVIDTSLARIAITQKPQKLTYEIGEKLDFTGLKVTAYYNDNTSKAVTDYTVSGKTDKAGEQTVTVTFEGKKATFKITILEALPFKDVKKSDWFYPGVLYSYRAGLMNGTSATTFAPKMNMTRAQMVMILYNLEGQPSVKGMKNPFKDVSTGKWYTNAVVWAANEGLVYGTSATTFAPDLELSRSQLVTILFRYAQEKGLDNGKRDNLKGFADKATVPSWALEATQWAVANKIVSGIPSGNKLNVAPLTVASRSQVATILKGFLDK